ncbi:MAG: FG-GAP-like repeat-containing protein [Flavobacteriales bacterium]|nr:FG-GAP-like repeat-containing protein [Flavobacteriales bacterium]
MRNSLIVSLLLLQGFSSFAQPVLTEVSESIGLSHHAVMCDFQMPAQGGAAWFDYDNDGWYDLYLTGGSVPDALFRNNGDGTFTDRTADAGIGVIANVFTDGVTTGDVNRDGWDDILVTTFKTAGNYLFLNNGDGTFAVQLNWAGAVDSANSFSATFGDLNMDGWLDLYICNWSRYMQVTVNGGNVSVDSEANYYYQNNGDGTFTERAEDLGLDDPLGCGLGVMITDFDNDFDPDLFVANDFGQFYGNSPNRLYRNDSPLESFVEVSNDFGLDSEINGMGVAKTDVNFDGVFDYYTTNIRNDKFMVSSVSGYEDELVDRGMKNDSVWLQNLTVRHWNVGWGAGFLDIDNDMDEDLMVANGSLRYDYPWPALDSNRLFLNDGNGDFVDVSFETGIADTYVSRALAYCDYDLDGDLDVFVGITDSINGTSHSFLFRNDSPPKNWLQVKAVGVENNTNGIGAKVVVYINGQSQMREIGGQSSFNSQHWHVAHFGLGNNLLVDSLQVIWYGGGIDRYYHLNANQFMEVTEEQGLITGIGRANELEFQVHPNPFTHEINLTGSPVEKLELYDSKGSLVVSSSVKLGEAKRIETSHLPAGNYLLKIELTGGVSVMRKLIKE